MDEINNKIITTEETVKVDKQNKSLEAKGLIEASQERVAKIDSEVAECQVDISEAAEEFDSVKRTFKNVTLKKSDNLLEKVGVEYVTFEEAEAFELSVNISDEDNFSVQKLSSGRFTGLILAILAALVTAGVWVYLAISKLAIDTSSLDIEKITSHVNPILEWIGGEMVLGAIILGFSSLIVGWLVYALRMKMKASKNLRMAKDTFDKSSEYCSVQEECQKEMKKVNAHLRAATVEVGNLEMILNEQASILKRIIHVEGTVEEEKEYHPSSKKVMRETEKIMKASEDLLETAITEERKLNFQSVQALNSARSVYAEYLTRIYD